MINRVSVAIFCVLVILLIRAVWLSYRHLYIAYKWRLEIRRWQKEASALRGPW